MRMKKWLTAMLAVLMTLGIGAPAFSYQQWVPESEHWHEEPWTETVPGYSHTHDAWTETTVPAYNHWHDGYYNWMDGVNHWHDGNYSWVSGYYHWHDGYWQPYWVSGSDHWHDGYWAEEWNYDSSCGCYVENWYLVSGYYHWHDGYWSYYWVNSYTHWHDGYYQWNNGYYHWHDGFYEWINGWYHWHNAITVYHPAENHWHTTIEHPAGLHMHPGYWETVVDTTPPSVAISASPSGTVSAGTVVSASWSASDAGAGMGSVSVTLSDNGTSSTISTAASGSVSVTAVAGHTYTWSLSATDNDGNSASASTSANVPAAATLSSVSVSASNTAPMVNQQITFTVIATYSDNTTKDVSTDAGTSYSTSPAGILSTSGNTATATAAGSTTVTASYGGKQASVGVTVNQAATTTIGNVSVSNVSATTATVSWTTSSPATGHVTYSTDQSYSTSGPGDSVNYVTSHSFTLTGLSPNTTYYFKVRSRDQNGVLVEKTDSTTQTFTNTSMSVTVSTPSKFNVRLAVTVDVNGVTPDSVEVFADNTSIGYASQQYPGRWTFDWLPTVWYGRINPPHPSDFTSHTISVLAQLGGSSYTSNSTTTAHTALANNPIDQANVVISTYFDQRTTDCSELDYSGWTGTYCSGPYDQDPHAYDGHMGYDLATWGSAADPFYAARAGTVDTVVSDFPSNTPGSWGNGCGNYVILDHGTADDGQRYLTGYCHASSIASGITQGASVTDHQQLGNTGNTGTSSTGVHLHFQINVGNNQYGSGVDPYENGLLSPWYCDHYGNQTGIKACVGH